MAADITATAKTVFTPARQPPPQRMLARKRGTLSRKVTRPMGMRNMSAAAATSTEPRAISA